MVQNREWLAWPPPLLRTAGLDTAGRVAHQVVDVHVGLGRAGHGGVQVCHVCGVVPVVMDLHRAGVDMGLESSEIVREVGYGKGHRESLLGMMGRRIPILPAGPHGVVWSRPPRIDRVPGPGRSVGRGRMKLISRVKAVGAVSTAA